MSWPCFWVEETDEVELSLRRYASRDDKPCPGPDGYHNASVKIGRRKARRTVNGAMKEWPYKHRRDKRWPTTCAACPYEFEPEDHWQVNQEPIYRRPDTGHEWGQRDLPVGAMYDGRWWRTFGVGPDGIALMVILPTASGDARVGAWHVDGPARSHEGGTKPNAWTRTGDPRAVPPTVDVNPSILTNEYHGYLRNGGLTDPV